MELRDGTLTEDRRLDRLVHYDERSLAYPIAKVVPTEVRSKTWGIPGAVLDQGAEGACVGFGVTHELRAYPAAVGGVGAKYARETVYWEAQRNDPWPGGSYPGASPQYEGTAVIEGVKAMVRAGRYGEYRWAFKVEDIMRAVSWEGPVIVGTHWLTGMDEVDEDGVMAVGGSVRGGHCYLIRGLILNPRFMRGPVFRIRNSWGPDWGHGGDAFVSVSDFKSLLEAEGEAVIPMRRTK